MPILASETLLCEKKSSDIGNANVTWEYMESPTLGVQFERFAKD